MELWWNNNWQGKPKYSGKTCSSSILSIANRIWPDLGSNLGCHDWKPVTNCLSYSTALTDTCYMCSAGFTQGLWKNLWFLTNCWQVGRQFLEISSQNKAPGTSLPPASGNYALKNLTGCHSVLCSKFWTLLFKKCSLTKIKSSKLSVS
jgi:hypothetical protein